MAWIESHQELRIHRKTGRLARRLNITRVTAIGHLHCLWWWAVDNAPNGSLTAMESADIADGAYWDGDPDDLLEALVYAGFIDRTDTRLELHDWDEYAGKLIERRRLDAERKKASRHAVSNADVTTESRQSHDSKDQSGGCPADVHGTARVTVQYSTVPNRTQPEVNPEDGCKEVLMSDSSSDVPASFEEKPVLSIAQKTKRAKPDPSEKDVIQELMDYYRLKIQPAAIVEAGDQIKARLKTFTVHQLKQGMDNFAADEWWMEHNAHRGAKWFFQSDQRSEQFLNLSPRKEHDNGDRSGSYPALDEFNAMMDEIERKRKGTP